MCCESWRKFRFPHPNLVCIYTCHVSHQYHHLYSTTRVVCGEEWVSWSFSSCSFLYSSITVFLSCPNIFNFVLSNTVARCSSRHMRDQVIRPHAGVDKCIVQYISVFQPSPVAWRSKTRVCGCLFAGIAGSNSDGGTDVCPLWMLCVVK